jgi:hypothetical protein
MRQELGSSFLALRERDRESFRAMSFPPFSFLGHFTSLTSVRVVKDLYFVTWRGEGKFLAAVNYWDSIVALLPIGASDGLVPIG